MKQKHWFTIKRVHSQAFAIAEFQHFEKVVSYLAVGKTEAVLFDTGMGHADIWKEVQAITSLPVSIFLTHAHWDHVGGLKSDADVYVFDDPFEKKLLEKDFRGRYQAVGDGQLLTIDGIPITVIHTPGHTPGSACYFINGWNVLVAGDTIYPGPLYAHLPESDMAAYSQSVKKLLAKTNIKTLILPGHNAVSCSRELLDHIDKGFDVLFSGCAGGKPQKDGVLRYNGSGFSILCRSLL